MSQQEQVASQVHRALIGDLDDSRQLIATLTRERDELERSAGRERQRALLAEKRLEQVAQRLRRVETERDSMVSQLSDSTNAILEIASLLEVSQA